jgi:NADH:ubiquinone oxidoreductase subunit B-like Fe-S oxidoreductase
MVAVRTELPAGVITLLLLERGSTPSPFTAASSREARAIEPAAFMDGGVDFRRVEAATGFSSRQADLRLVPQDAVFVLFLLEAANASGKKVFGHSCQPRYVIYGSCVSIYIIYVATCSYSSIDLYLCNSIYSRF